MDPSVVAAIVSGVIALIGVIASTIVTRIQYRNQHELQSKQLDLHVKELEAQLEQQRKEFELRTRELETATKQLEAEYEAVYQAQYTEVLKKRMDAYPKIWKVFVEYMINLKVANKPQDAEWVNSFLTAINDCNAEVGVFFSEDFYKKFARFRHLLIELKKICEEGKPVPENEIHELEKLFYGTKTSSGLSAVLKDDLGSYTSAAIELRGGR